MAVVGVELETLVSELDALTIRPPPFDHFLDNVLHIQSNLIIMPLVGIKVKWHCNKGVLNG